ncbi:hypothetical protein [Janthinobacterium psychrotolerans]|uniref:MSHA biogenesis protein MshK n=1 Tax=Janthinobacterium psychrotolerans TaxID=1747903 RepID=A0A1A7BXL0_9BURK|nr:hypothetical protein [Janthinobacterium psychrotolerans]OBV38257.1 MSHA biogenesis protein MshK [Janthinobacterium psychrotolerans]
MDFTLKVAALALLAALLPQAMAQGLVDPTRPPDAPLPGNQAGAIDRRVAPQLQSVLVASSGRRVAVIDGRTVRVGDKVGAASVAAIGDTTVSLQRGKKIETIRLYPQAAGQNKAGKKQIHAY